MCVQGWETELQAPSGSPPRLCLVGGKQPELRAGDWGEGTCLHRGSARGPFAEVVWATAFRLFILTKLGVRLMTSGLRPPPAATVLSQADQAELRVSLTGVFRSHQRLQLLVLLEKFLQMPS